MNICLSGAAGNGKTFLADALVEQGYTRLSLATPVKELSVEVYNTIAGYLGKPKITMEELQANKKRYRSLMQHVGTELGRDMFGKTVWIDRLDEILMNTEFPVVIDDARFTNEIDFLLTRNFVPVYVSRFEVNGTHTSEQLSWIAFKDHLQKRKAPKGLFRNVLPPEEAKKNFIEYVELLTKAYGSDTI